MEVVKYSWQPKGLKQKLYYWRYQLAFLIMPPYYKDLITEMNARKWDELPQDFKRECDYIQRKVLMRTVEDWEE